MPQAQKKKNNIYGKIQSLCRKAFYDSHSKIFLAINDFLSFLTIISIAVIILETVSGLAEYYPFLIAIEYITVFFFSVEYLCRIIGADKKKSYIFSFFGFVDLLAIIPSWLHLANLTPLKSARAIRILRFLRTLRLAKLERIEISSGNKKNEFSEIYKINLKIYLLAFISVIIILGSLVYIFENGNNGFQDIPSSMLWAARVILADQGAIKIFPESIGGQAVSLISRFFGLVLLGFLIKIIGDLANRFLLGIKKIDRDTLDNKF